MMVSIRQTTLKYHGRKAETYDSVREKQARWHWENGVVERWLRELKPSSVLDCPVGTGRFIPLYANLSVQELIGVDVSAEMLALAKKKIPRAMRNHCTPRLELGDARKHECVDERVDCAVCVRFLDLIDEEAMRATVVEMMRVARRAVILTIRLGDKYVAKSNTAEHDERKFLALVRKGGWQVGERVPFRDAGWWIIKLERKDK